MNPRVVKSLAHAAGPAAIAAAGAAMLYWSWRRWPDVLIDFGRELYVPWRLCEGDALYRDLAYFNGPLSPYVNAFLFRIFGVSFETLAFCNLVLTTLLIGLLYHIIARVADRRAAAAAGLFFVTVFAFGQLDTNGNYNYVAPYSHEMTHGLLLGVLALLTAARYAAWGVRSSALVGLLLGLIFLTKLEVFIATAPAVVAGFVLTAWSRGVAPARTLRDLAVMALAMGVAPLVAVALLSTAMPFSTALRGTLGAWAFVLDEALTSQHFYRLGLGTLHLEENLASMLRWTATYGLIYAPLVALAFLLRARWLRRLAAVAAVLFFFLVATTGFGAFVPAEAVRPLPILLPIFAALSLVRSVRLRRAGREDPAGALRLMLIVFAALMLAKIFFNVRLIHYGFALAMPGTLVLVAALVGWLPHWIDERGGAGGLVRTASLAALALVALGVLSIVSQQLALRIYRVGVGPDHFYAEGRGDVVERLRVEIESRLAPDETFAVLPEGVMLNYLTRRVNPTGHLNFMPPELIMFGESEILAAFQKKPPDYIVIAHKETTEYGARFFGQDYGQELWAWLASRYSPVWRAGAMPLRTWRFGIQLFERNGRTARAPNRAN